MVAEARRKQQSDSAATPEAAPEDASFRARLDKIREEVTVRQPGTAFDPPKVVNEQEVEADLARRRSRLSQ